MDVVIKMWSWLEFIGLVSGCCCIRRYIDFLIILLPLLHYLYYIPVALFLQHHPTSLFIFKIFFRSFIYNTWSSCSSEEMMDDFFLEQNILK